MRWDARALAVAGYGKDEIETVMRQWENAVANEG